MTEFTYPNHHSQCDILLASTLVADTQSFMAQVRVSGGYNLYAPPFHVVGLHLGTPLPILRRYQQQEKLFGIHAGSIFVAPVGATLESAHPTPTEALYIHLNPLLLTRIAESVGIPAQAIHLTSNLGADDPLIAHIGQSVMQELRAPGLGGMLYLEALLMQLSVHLIRHYTADLPPTLRDRFTVTSPRHPLRTALEFIHDHLAEPITLSDLARIEGLSPFHFSRLFRQAYGIAPYQYVIRKRVERAEELLKNPALTVNEVALLVGFSTHSHLNRHFKRLTGRTPRT